LRLLGVNKSGTEYACAQGWGIFDGSFDLPAVLAMKSWGINAVRIPLNSACWLSRNSVANSKFTGTVYRFAIIDVVKLLQTQGMVAILDLHVNPPRDGMSVKTTVNMPNQDAIVFWKSVAVNFKLYNNVLFDLFNEPQGVDWGCWRDGCSFKDGKGIVGMQSLVDAIRVTGSKAPIIFEANSTSTDFSMIDKYKLVDPLNQLIASNHNYQGMTGSNNLESWNRKYLPVAKNFPLLTGELGQADCKHDYVDSYMDWADLNGVSYLGWTWNVENKYWPCLGKHSLVKDSQGTPTEHGIGFRNHFLKAAI
jgi:endoglucanase